MVAIRKLLGLMTGCQNLRDLFVLYQAISQLFQNFPEILLLWKIWPKPFKKGCLGVEHQYTDPLLSYDEDISCHLSSGETSFIVVESGLKQICFSRKEVITLHECIIPWSVSSQHDLTSAQYDVEYFYISVFATGLACIRSFMEPERNAYLRSICSHPKRHNKLQLKICSPAEKCQIHLCVLPLLRNQPRPLNKCVLLSFPLQESPLVFIIAVAKLLAGEKIVHWCCRS